MNGRILLSAGLMFAAGFAAAETFTESQLAAKFYFDLGPATVDASQYPKEAREGYRIFARVCSKCHSPARPLNAPITDKADWRRLNQS